MPKDIVEASDAFGATSMQTLWKVQLPLARPSILLGVNQTVIMVFSVVIIAGLVGGAGLGYLVVDGLSHDPGVGVIAGIAILLMAIVIDRITQALGQASPERRMADRGPSSVMAPSRAAARPRRTKMTDLNERGKHDEATVGDRCHRGGDLDGDGRRAVT